MRIAAALLASTAAALVAAGCGGGSTSRSGSPGSSSTQSARPVAAPPKFAPPPYPRLLPSAVQSRTTRFVPAVRWRGQTAVSIARSRSGVAMLSFNQRFVELHLHSGTVDAGTGGWRFGAAIARSERRHLVAAFNGGFKFDTGAGGFMSYGRVAVPLRDGLGSIVTYINGDSDIGSWHHELPGGGAVASVRQNLSLLIDHGSAAGSVGCESCWGATLGGISDPARAALGTTSAGRLIWAGGEHLTVSELAGALIGTGVVRAVELDINPEWVAAYLYGHRSGVGPLAPVPVVPDQSGVPGRFIAPYGRDFYTVVVR